jgi:hypothetical protein
MAALSCIMVPPSYLSPSSVIINTMVEINYLSLVVATVVAFVASFIWYIIFAKQMSKLGSASTGKPNPKLIAGEFVKNVVLAVALLYFVIQLGVHTLFGVVHLTLLLWIAFPVLILISSVMYEKVALKLAAIHAGDWLLKLILMTAILGFWH